MLQATITVGQHHRLSFVLGLGILKNMREGHAQEWISSREEEVRKMVELLMKLDPSNTDFVKVMIGMRVALGFKFSDGAREALIRMGGQIVSLPWDLSFLTVDRYTRPSLLPRTSIWEEAYYAAEEVAWFPDTPGSMFVPNSLGLGFKDLDGPLGKFSDKIKEATGGRAQPVIPNVAIACYLLHNLFDADRVWRREGIRTWTTDSAIDRIAVEVRRGSIQIDLWGHTENLRQDDLGLLSVIAPTP